MKKSISIALVALLTSPSGYAGEPTTVPNTYVDLPAPQLTSWSDINVHTIDGTTGATAKSHIYQSVDAKNDPNIGSVAAVYWELDNGSGRAPGIQVVTDDFDFPTNNCIMASGELESDEFGVVLPKTCSDPEGSSKRYFLELTESDEPVDLVFNLGAKDIRYKGIKDPATDGGEELAQFRETYDIGRIYRVIQKIINNTDERIASFKFEIGTGLGDAFQPLNYEDDGVSFEMRSLVPREFLEGETGAPDIRVWNPLRFATFSPKMFDDGSRDRFEPGFLDHQAAGFLPPQIPAAGIEKSSIIDSGLTIVDGRVGSITPNYFDVAGTQGVTLPGNMLGYMLPDSLLPTVIGEYHTNDVGGESEKVHAIWDGTNWRSGRAGLDGDPATTPDNYTIIPDNQLEQWAGQLLGLELGEAPGEQIIRFDSFLSDDLSGLNTDIFIFIGEKLLDETGQPTLDSITLRVTANSVAQVIGDVAGTEAPDWMIDDDMDPATPLVSNAPSLADYLPGNDNTPIALNDVRATEENITEAINVLANDLFKVADMNVRALEATDVVSVNILTAPANGTAEVYSGSDPALENTIIYTGDVDFSGVDTLEYSVTAAGGIESNTATVTVNVEPTPVPDAPIAANDAAVTFRNTPVTLDVLANDDLNKGSPISILVSVDNTPLNGSAVVEEDNTIAYTPANGYVGSDRFTYNVLVDGKLSNSALITVRVDEPVVDPADSVPFMESSSSGGSLGILMFPVAGLLLARRRKDNGKKEA
ncbi:choice-of-anchor F family protein [Alcanivorax sp. IL3]|uniref:choice-of-anchor F family protein n=1 Tax=unclassified Alcanivorax TaxID=2638842 RepID=UPI0039C069A4